MALDSRSVVTGNVVTPTGDQTEVIAFVQEIWFRNHLQELSGCVVLKVELLISGYVHWW